MLDHRVLTSIVGPVVPRYLPVIYIHIEVHPGTTGIESQPLLVSLIVLCPLTPLYISMVPVGPESTSIDIRARSV